MFGYRIGILDIENFANLGYAWEVKDRHPRVQNLISVERAWVMASLAIRWEGEDKTTCVKLNDFKRTYKNDPFDDTEVVKRAAEIMDEANMLVGHNVRNFDVKKINTRMIKLGFNPPRPFRTYDTLGEFQNIALFPSNKLGDLAKFLGCPLGGKVEHEGWPLWLKCQDGKEESWDIMAEYNIQDVDINQWIYHKIRPWTKSHPNITVFSGEDALCPVCGSKTTLQEQPYALKSYAVDLYRCRSKPCGKYSYGHRFKIDNLILSS